MIPFAILLFSIGLADLVVGFAGVPHPPPETVALGGAQRRKDRRKRVRAATGIAVGLASTCACGLLAGLGVPATLLLTGVFFVLMLSWISVRWPDELSESRGALGLVSVVAVLVVAIITSDLWPNVSTGTIRRWLDRTPIDALAGVPVEVVLLTVGLASFLLATSNGLVRLGLATAGSKPDVARKLKGGRVVGALERILIFGFLATDQSTAAVLIVSAKALLRFPEVTRVQGDVHDLTEYLLVGSLASWVIAFAAATLIRGVALP